MLERVSAATGAMPLQGLVALRRLPPRSMANCSIGKSLSTDAMMMLWPNSLEAKSPLFTDRLFPEDRGPACMESGLIIRAV